jgi:hypothetical protein
MIHRKSTSLTDHVDRYLAMLRLAGHTHATCKYYYNILHRLAERFNGRAAQHLDRDELHAYLGELADAVGVRRGRSGRVPTPRFYAPAPASFRDLG